MSSIDKPIRSWKKDYLGSLSLIALVVLWLLFSSKSTAQDLSSLENAAASADEDNAVLAHMEWGLALLQQGKTDQAKEAFIFVLTDLESFFSNTEDSIQARSLWWEEGRKSFKGEPYERAMAFYYMGVIYLMEGDFENARASFVSGLLQDSFAEEEQDRSDLASFMLLEYWAAIQAGSEALAQAALADFQQLRPGFEVPHPDTHALVVLETGFAPRKLNDGVSGERLVFRRGKGFEDRYAYLTVADTSESFSLTPIEDVYYQASTRGARAIDGINGGKASYKQTWTDRSSSVANLANQFTLYSNLARDYSDYYAMQSYGAGASDLNLNIEIHSQEISAAASLVSLIGSRFKAKADIRNWSNLPDTLHIGFVPQSALVGATQLKYTYQDERRSDIGEISIPLADTVGTGNFYWSKVH